MCGEEGKIKGHKNTKKLMIYLRILYFTHTSSINSLHPVAFHVNKSAFIIPFSFHSKANFSYIKKCATQFGGGRCVAILWVYSSMGVGYGKNGKKLYELKNCWSCRWISQCEIRDKELKVFSCSQFHFETYLCNCPRNE